jgi:hypothetical protein
MSIMQNKKLWAAIVACSVGTVFQGIPQGCTQYYTALTLSSFDFCSVFNCEGGTFFNFCQPFAVFMDCPNLFS